MGNKKTVYNGITFDSKKEAKFAMMLDIDIKLKKILSYQVQKVFHIEINGVNVCKYIADFVVVKNDGSQVVVDVKSEYTRKLPVYRLKKKLMKAVHGIDIIENGY